MRFKYIIMYRLEHKAPYFPKQERDLDNHTSSIQRTYGFQWRSHFYRCSLHFLSYTEQACPLKTTALRSGASAALLRVASFFLPALLPVRTRPHPGGPPASAACWVSQSLSSQHLESLVPKHSSSHQPLLSASPVSAATLPSLQLPS